jgi:flagellar M-ring protein FliF
MVTVQDLTFEENRTATAVSLPGQVLNTAENSQVLVKYAALMAGLIVVLAFGVRPALRRAGQAALPEAKLIAGALPAGAVAHAQSVLKPPEAVELDPERIRAQEIYDQVTGHLKREPSQSSRLLQSWIHSD